MILDSIVQMLNMWLNCMKVSRFVNYEVLQGEKAKSFHQSMENLACFDWNLL